MSSSGMTPTLRQLEYLVALARTLNFREAAEACHVSQPGLSGQIQQLEATLGVVLFERDRRRVLVTPAGERLVQRARAVLAEVDDLVAAARAESRPLTGTLRLGVIPTVAPYLLPRLLPRVAEAHPELRVLLREDQTAALRARLEAAELDVLLLALEADLGAVGTAPVLDDPFVLAAPRDHPLLEHDAVPLDRLAGESVLLLEDGHCLRDQAVALCGRAGLDELDDFRASSLGTLVQMVASGVGVTLLPAMAVDVEVRAAGHLGVAPLETEVGRTIGLAWRSGSPRGDEFTLLARTLQAAAAPSA